MSTEDKLDQAINPQPEYQEPSSANPRPEGDASRIGGGQSLGDNPEGEANPGSTDRPGSGPGTKSDD